MKSLGSTSGLPRTLSSIGARVKEPFKYSYFKKLSAWQKSAKKCRTLEQRGVTPRSVKSWLLKADKLRKEATALEKKAKFRCSHPVEEQYIESIPVTEQESYQDTQCAFLGLFCKGVTKYKTVTNYKDVVKTKDVTQYREETRYRTVTKTRTETREKEVLKTRMETRYKEVNWIFGFDAIIELKPLLSKLSRGS